jgi:hypothetical protein
MWGADSKGRACRTEVGNTSLWRAYRVIPQLVAYQRAPRTAPQWEDLKDLPQNLTTGGTSPRLKACRATPRLVVRQWVTHTAPPYEHSKGLPLNLTGARTPQGLTDTVV